MERTAMITAMKSSIFEVLETMFFLPLELSDKDNLEYLKSSSKDKLLASKLVFNGPFSGYFLFIVPYRLAISMTANFLGKDADNVSHDQIADTVRETLNMIAGKTFNIFDDQAVFRLDIPQIVDSDEVIRETQEREGQELLLLINTMDGSLAIKMVINNI